MKGGRSLRNAEAFSLTSLSMPFSARNFFRLHFCCWKFPAVVQQHWSIPRIGLKEKSIMALLKNAA
jgi:hypothetical protein